MGYGKLHIQEVRARYECQRKPECGLRWSETYPMGLPLQLYVGDKDVELEVCCDGCKFARTYKAEALIRQFQLSGTGDGNLASMWRGATFAARAADAGTGNGWWRRNGRIPCW